MNDAWEPPVWKARFKISSSRPSPGKQVAVAGDVEKLGVWVVPRLAKPRTSTAGTQVPSHGAGFDHLISVTCSTN